MKEIVTKAIVLSITPLKEKDSMTSLFTDELGVIDARVVGAKKPLSKFAQHLDPINLVTVRLVKKNIFTVTDVLEENRFNKIRKDQKKFSEGIKIICLLQALLPREFPEGELWHHVVRLFTNGESDVHSVLKILGYDVRHATCGMCGKSSITSFSQESQMFLCGECGMKFPPSDILYI